MNPFDFDALPLVERFADLANAASYHTPPPSWWVVVTDVVGSTRAIEAGRYKDVNILGAASIVTAKNAASGRSLPFVFGGDGATLLVPGDVLEAVASSLLGLEGLASETYGLGLRVGGVPVEEILKRGPLGVARFRLDEGADLAMFWGDGVSIAEDLVKSDSERWGFDVEPRQPDLAGLTCRWKPIPARKGVMLSVLIKATEDDADARAALYSELFAALESLGLVGEENRPVDEARLELELDRVATETEAPLVRSNGLLSKALARPKVRFMNTMGSFLMKRGWSLGGFDGRRYAASTVSRTDFRKFDDALRMVIDLDDEQRHELESLLERLRAEGRLAYGLHASNDALMTCIVDDHDTRHLHFIDGANGGYALAAKDLKRQLLEDGSRS